MNESTQLLRKGSVISGDTPEADSRLGSPEYIPPSTDSLFESRPESPDLAHAVSLRRQKSEQFEIDTGEGEENWNSDYTEQLSALPWYNRPSFTSIAIILFLISVAASCGQPTKDSLNAKLACRAVSADGDLTCDPVAKQLLLSNLNLVCSISISIVSIFVSAKVGPLSDSYGRTPFFTYYILVNFSSSLLSLWIYSHYPTLKFWLTVSTSLVASLSGGNYSLLSLSNAYTSDIMKPAQRIYFLGMVSAVIFAGSTLGPILSNWVLAQSHDVTPIIKESSILRKELIPIKLEVSIQVLVMIFTRIFLKESRSPRALSRTRALKSSQIIEPAGLVHRVAEFLNFLKPIKLLALPNSVVKPSDRSRISRVRPTVILLVTVEILMALVDDIVRTIINQYGIYRFNWGATELGYFSSINSFASAIVLMIISPLLTTVVLSGLFKYSTLDSQFDMIDFGMLFIALANESFSFLLLYLSQSSNELIFAGNMLTLSLIGGPTLTSAMLKFYPESKVGEFFGAQSILKNALGLLSPLVFQSFYKYTLQIDRANLSFVVYAIIIFVCSVLVVLVKKLIRLDRKTVEYLGDDGSHLP